MTTEVNTVKLIVLTEGQARYLMELSRAAKDYRDSWESIIKRGQDEIDRLKNNQWVAGPSHQIMAEVQQEYGKVMIALDLLWSVFRVDTLPEDADKQEAAKEVGKFVAIALAPNAGKNGSLSGGTWFREGYTLNDF